MAGMLVRNEVDIALGPFGMTIERYETGEFAGIYTTNHLTILAALSGEKQVDGFRSIYLLDRWTWISSLISFFVCSFVMTLVERSFTGGSKSREDNAKRSGTFGKSYRRYLWYNFGNIFSENDYKKLKKNSTRIIVGAWCYFILIVSNGIQGSLIATLTLRTEKRPIETISDIIQRPEIIPYVQMASVYEIYLKNRKEPEFRKLWQMVEDKNGSVPPQKLFSLDTFRQVMKGEAVLVTDYLTMSFYVSKHCKALGSRSVLYFGRQNFFHHGFTILLSRNLRPNQLELLTRKSKNLFEASLPLKWSSGTGRNLCAAQKAAQENRSLSLEDLQGIFYVMTIGVAGSLLLFAMELFVHYSGRQCALLHRF